jgi:hypothetical protein
MNSYILASLARRISSGEKQIRTKNQVLPCLTHGSFSFSTSHQQSKRKKLLNKSDGNLRANSLTPKRLKKGRVKK